MRAADRQMSLPMPVQRRNSTRESLPLYAAVLVLRSRGMTVYRNGRNSTVNGVRLTPPQLMKLARATQ